MTKKCCYQLRPSSHLIAVCYLLLSVFISYVVVASTANTNYYELLNLETNETHRPKKQLSSRKKRSSYRARITNDQVKKAYRKQAQLYHPDKASRNNMTVEEATSRFAQIAEAYQVRFFLFIMLSVTCFPFIIISDTKIFQVLSDPVQRYEYDRELIHTEEEEEEERLFLQEAEQMRERDQRRQKQQYQQQQYQQRQNQNNDWVYDSSSFYDRMRDKASNLHAWKESLNNIDAWRVFEDFFFQETTVGDSNAYPDSSSSSSSTANQYREAQKNPPNNSNYRNSQAPHVSETTVHRGYDPYMDADVYTVYRREDYENGEYRVIGQDFIQGVEVDPYTGFVLQEYYSAITGPYLVEEGSAQQQFRRKDDFVNDFHYEKLYGQKQKQQFATYHDERKSPRSSSSRLEQGESISLNDDSSDPWLSPNGKFEAHLSPTCELQIIRRYHETDKDTEDEIDPDDTLVWSSETYIPDTRAHGCHLTLSSLGRLVLSIDYGSGLGQVGNSVLWNSPVPPVVPYWVQGDQQQSVTFYYYASLDDDGVIAIYRVRETSDGDEKQGNDQSAKHHQPPSARKPNVINTLGAVYGRISKTSTEFGQTKAALAYDQLRHNMGSLFMGRPRSAGAASSFSGPDSPPTSNNEKLQTPNVQLHHECVYSTSPAGCIAPGRNAIHLTKKLARSIKRSVKNMDSHLDNLISMLTQPADEYDYDTYDAYDGYGYSSAQDDSDDDDYDVLDTLFRVTGAAGKIGLEAAQVGMKQGRKAAGKVVGKMKTKIPQVVGKMKERVMYSFDEYGNS